MLFGMLLASCGGSSKTTTDTVDSVEVVTDSTTVDTLTVEIVEIEDSVL